MTGGSRAAPAAPAAAIDAPIWSTWRCLRCEVAALRAVSTNEIACGACDKRYPILDGIPAFVEDVEAHQRYIQSVAAERPTWFQAEQVVDEKDDPWLHVRRRADAVVRGLLERNVRPGTLALDLGCGDGRNLPQLREVGLHVVGTDYNLLRLGRAARGGTSAGYDALFMADAKNLPVPERFFDVVYCNQVLEHIPGPGEVLRSIARILKDDGVLILGVPNEGCWYHQLKFRLKPALRHVTDHVNFFTATSLAALMRESGFAVADTRGVTWGLPATGDGIMGVPTRIDRRLRRHAWYNAAWEGMGRALLPNQYFELYMACRKARPA